MKKASLILILTLAVARNAGADTLVVVGVAVNSAGERMAGALVRLYATAQANGQPMAEDRTSERGIFTLYRTNIAGDIGDLYVVYFGEQGRVANPLKVTMQSADTGLRQSRTPDLVVLPPNLNASIEEVADRIAAATNTQGVLLQVNATTKDKSEESIQAAVKSATATIDWTAANARVVVANTDKLLIRELPMRDTAIVAMKSRAHQRQQ